MTEKSKTEQKKSCEVNLMELIKKKKMLTLLDGVHVEVIAKGKKEQLRLNSLDFKNYISYEHYNTYGYFPSENAIKNIIRYFCGAAIGSSLIEQATRIAERNGKIHYDLHNDQMEVVIVDKEGWKISKNNDIYFNQSANIFEQVKPISNNRNIIDLLRPYINLNEEEELLFIVYLLSCFILGIQHPIMNITGGKGTGKSTMLSVMKKVIDPSKVERLTLTDKEDDMAVLLSRNYFCVVDNVSSLNKKMSDILCQAVTGGAKYKRKLYTDNEEVIVEYRAILAMNGINNIISQDDLLQRTIFLSAKSIAVNERKLEKDFWDNFQKDLPYILGAIFDIASEVLRDIDKVQLRIFNRLADFDKYGCAISEAICVGYSKKFMKAMEKNKQKQLWYTWEKMPKIRLLVDFMENKNKWEGLMSDFLTELEDYVNNHPEDTSEKDIPSNIALPKICKRFESDLLSLGLEIKISRTKKDNKSSIKIIKIRDDLKRIPIKLERKAIITDKK